MPDRLSDHLLDSPILYPRKWLHYPSFKGGVGTRYRRSGEDRTEKRRYGYVAGDCDTFDDPWHRPLLSTSTTPTSITASKTDYAAMAEVYWGGWYTYLVKGPYIWRTQSAAFGAALDTKASAEGRQLLDVVVGTTTLERWLVWICGASALVQYSTDGAAFADLDLSAGTKYALCGWNQQDDDGDWYLCIIEPDGDLWRASASTWAQFTNAKNMNLKGSAGPIPLGFLNDPKVQFIANGPDVWALDFSSAIEEWKVYPTPCREITAGCKYRDRFVITDGTIPWWWHPTQGAVPMHIWGRDGVPPDWAGSIKSLQAVGDVLIAYYELDAGGTVLFWTPGFNAEGECCWHPRNKTLTGGFPSSIGSPFLLAQQTYSGAQRLWTVTADGSAGRAYYQDFPKHSLNPLWDSTMQYEPGPSTLYGPFDDLVTLGPDRGVIKAAHRNADLSATETLTVSYRKDYDGTAEVGATWTDLITFTDAIRGVDQIEGGEGIDTDAAVQFRYRLNGTGAATERVRDIGFLVGEEPRNEGDRSRKV